MPTAIRAQADPVARTVQLAFAQSQIELRIRALAPAILAAAEEARANGHGDGFLTEWKSVRRAWRRRDRANAAMASRRDDARAAIKAHHAILAAERELIFHLGLLAFLVRPAGGPSAGQINEALEPFLDRHFGAFEGDPSSSTTWREARARAKGDASAAVTPRRAQARGAKS